MNGKPDVDGKSICILTTDGIFRLEKKKHFKLLSTFQVLTIPESLQYARSIESSEEAFWLA